MDVEIKISDLVLSCRLRQNNTAKKISKLLPLKSIVNTWGDEIYFKIPKINLNIEDNAKDIVNLGEIAFWIEGNSIAIGFGRTPISQLDEIRLAAKGSIIEQGSHNYLLDLKGKYFEMWEKQKA